MKRNGEEMEAHTISSIKSLEKIIRGLVEQLSEAIEAVAKNDGSNPALSKENLDVINQNSIRCWELSNNLESLYKDLKKYRGHHERVKYYVVTKTTANANDEESKHSEKEEDHETAKRIIEQDQ